MFRCEHEFQTAQHQKFVAVTVLSDQQPLGTLEGVASVEYRLEKGPEEASGAEERDLTVVH